jgi:RNA polymerase sigma-70 factor, ECF subfamily
MNIERVDDEKIIKMVLKGNVDLFRVIVERYQKKIYIIGMRFYKNTDDAYDFVQDVFIKVFDNLESFKGLSKFYYWLIKIAYNTGINSIKKSGIKGSLMEDVIVDEENSPERVHLRKEVRESIRKAIEELPEKYRVCVELYFYYGLLFSEIEEMTGIPVNTIKSNMSRAKHILRNALQGTVAEDYNEM